MVLLVEEQIFIQNMSYTAITLGSQLQLEEMWRSGT